MRHGIRFFRELEDSAQVFRMTGAGYIFWGKEPWKDGRINE